jgi:alpha-1,2-mannosyltransferase
MNPKNRQKATDSGSMESRTMREVPWMMAALGAVLLQGPLLLSTLRPGWHGRVDFFQDWSSAREALSGRNAYPELSDAAVRLLGEAGQGDRLAPRVNPHPPFSVLLCLPMAMLDYGRALWVWRLATAALIFAAVALLLAMLRSPLWPVVVAPQLLVLATAAPVSTTLYQGQWNGLLLALIVVAWAAARGRHHGLAGMALGFAAAIKLFPALLIGWLALRGRWRSVVVALMTFAILQGIAALVLGSESFGTHLQALRSAGRYRSGWTNASLPAFWARLFDPSLDWAMTPLLRAPILAAALTLVSCAAVLVVATRSALTAHDAASEDRSFGVALLATLLIGPLTWEHTLLLALPVPWLAPPRPGFCRVLTAIALTAAWVAPLTFFAPLIRLHGGQLAAGPLGLLGAPSINFYALTALLAAVAPDRTNRGESVNQAKPLVSA